MDVGGTENREPVFCSAAAEDCAGQLWDFGRASRTTLEIKAMVSAWKPDLLSHLFQPHADCTEYFVPPSTLRDKIWSQTKLLTQPICKNVFDYDSFAIKAKDAVNSWVRDGLRVHGYAALFGVIFGEAKKGPKAYNSRERRALSAAQLVENGDNRAFPQRADRVGPGGPGYFYPTSTPFICHKTREMQGVINPENELPANVAEGVISLMTEGLYTLTNKKIRKLLTLSNADIHSGTPCVGWPRSTDPILDFQLWVLKRANTDGAYTLMSLRAGTFVDLLAGNGENNAGVVAHSYVGSEPGRPNQEWRIAEQDHGYYTIQCVSTGTFLEMDGESAEQWRRISCSSATQDRSLQLWSLDRVSRTTLEIKEVMGSWKPDLLNPSRLFQPYGDQDEYWVLPYELRKTLWNETKLLDQAICRNTFDYDDFVIKVKDKMNSWARDTLRIYVSLPPGTNPHPPDEPTFCPKI
ncbi:carbohydrate-binding module family 13 protein [Tulasnella calospora MUT 4182]|uniref:Carbohydrate-binding module family 13 protein n=1 Tax=Tulasnella calospora MUT 4182 TaxID=1051891 RepID=A0A0C3QDT3_9AGAM|nr:carbohydrate-binding module family 13 protein [Tulasnella calospora MUT 4182]